MLSMLYTCILMLDHYYHNPHRDQRKIGCPVVSATDKLAMVQMWVAVILEEDRTIFRGNPIQCNLKGLITSKSQKRRVMRVLVVLVVVVASCFLFAEGTLPGFKATITQNGVNYAKDVGVKFLLQKLAHITIPDQRYLLNNKSTQVITLSPF